MEEAAAVHFVRSFSLSGSDIHIGSGIGQAYLEARHTVFDENVARLYPQLSGEPLAIIPSGEVHKTFETVMGLWQSFARASLSRNDCIIACGGGVTGDLAGFAAATWMRGIDWINIPTTLLAMVDASTGGKTGCDLPEGKNLVGAFHLPRLVIIDPSFLASLPENALADGWAEMIKHEIIGNLPHNHMPKGIPTAEMIADNLAVKVEIVRQDPLERLGKRVILNCGHTVGHAIETLTDYRISHGQAVAIGCVEEARLAVRLGLARESWPAEIASHFALAGLPVELPDGLTFARLKEQMCKDKKHLGKEVVFALPCGWGDVRAVKEDLS